MWNLRSALRNFGLRVKNAANGQNVAQTTTKEGRSEVDEEYKRFTSIRCLERNCRFDHFRSSASFSFAKGTHANDSGKWKDFEKERGDYHAFGFRGYWHWAEALGLIGSLGIGINLFYAKHDDLFRKQCPVEQMSNLGINSKWLASFYALSMPLYPLQGSLLKSVLPTQHLSTKKDVPEEVSREFDAYSSDGDYSEQSRGSTVSIHEEKVPYKSETAALMAILRSELNSIARDYVKELAALLGDSPVPLNSHQFEAQEEYNLALFHELGIGVKRNPEEALKHYVQAAFLDHPVAIDNLVALHRYSHDSASHFSPMHRSSSSPVLSAKPFSFSEVSSTSTPPQKQPVKGKFWNDEDSFDGSSGDSGHGLSRSSSSPDLSLLVSSH